MRRLWCIDDVVGEWESLLIDSYLLVGSRLVRAGWLLPLPFYIKLSNCGAKGSPAFKVSPTSVRKERGRGLEAGATVTMAAPLSFVFIAHTHSALSQLSSSVHPPHPLPTFPPSSPPTSPLSLSLPPPRRASAHTLRQLSLVACRVAKLIEEDSEHGFSFGSTAAAPACFDLPHRKNVPDARSK